MGLPQLSKNIPIVFSRYPSHESPDFIRAAPQRSPRTAAARCGAPKLRGRPAPGTLNPSEL